MKSAQFILFATMALFAGVSFANPIPLPVPASMPLEEMTITVGLDKHVTFTGDFTFDYIPGGVCGALPCVAVTEMQFPLPPVNASSVAVFQDGIPLPWAMSADTYPTVLPEYPSLAMIEWAGPFPVNGAVFTVGYEHDLFARGDEWVLFYSLGTGKYLPTYDKITTALIDIYLPDEVLGLEVLLDDVPVDPSLYSLTGRRLSLELTSDYGPFDKDLIISFQIPAPVPLSHHYPHLRNLRLLSGLRCAI
jgi:hypothetical protein